MELALGRFVTTTLLAVSTVPIIGPTTDKLPLTLKLPVTLIKSLVASPKSVFPVAIRVVNVPAAGVVPPMTVLLILPPLIVALPVDTLLPLNAPVIVVRLELPVIVNDDPEIEPTTEKLPVNEVDPVTCKVSVNASPKTVFPKTVKLPPSTILELTVRVFDPK